MDQRSRSSTSWAIARIILPLEAKECSGVVVQALRPWRIFLRKGDLTDVLDDSVLKSTEGEKSYVMRSRREIVFTLVGPSTASHGTPTNNIRLKWGNADPLLLRVIVGLQRKKNKMVQIVPLSKHGSSDALASWGEACVPLLEQNRGSPPDYGHKGPWSGIEVHTNIDDKDAMLTMRIEHNDSGRVPATPYWRTIGGYGKMVEACPKVLANQAQAAVAWQLAVCEVLKNNKWGLILNEDFQHKVKLMGFETNNPLHDDHGGMGAHWHLALRRLGQPHTYLRKLIPHIYLREDGGIDIEKTNKVDKRQGSYDLGVFGFRICRDDGDLQMGRIVTLQETKSKFCLHVQKSLQRCRDPVALWDDADNEGSRWIMLRRECRDTSERPYWFCSVRSNRFLHVRQSDQKEGSEVAQWLQDNDPGNQWSFSENGQLRSRRSRLVLRVPSKPLNRSRALQTSTSSWQSSQWKMNICGGTKNEASCSSYRIRVRSSNNVAKAQIRKDGSLWAEFRCYDDAVKGILRMEIKFCDHEKIEKRCLYYDPDTGTIRSGSI
mmetsp:Transcript_16734/g.27623  ORF Transcript_16734/g.27623 Transcript_16734/m.27623 type:complete len:547 (-) Transcript_16734:96-1736(-)